MRAVSNKVLFPVSRDNIYLALNAPQSMEQHLSDVEALTVWHSEPKVHLSSLLMLH